MSGDFLRDVPRGRRMAREVAQDGKPLLQAGGRVASSDDGLRAGLVQARIEDELAAALRVLLERHDRPSRDHAGEARDIGLRVDGAHAERMQFENFAGEIFVETRIAVSPHDRARSDRADIVEIAQHRRMRLDRDQHVGKPAQDVRADRLAFERAGKRAHERALVGGNAEMVRPEPHQPLDEADLGAEGGVDPGARLIEVESLGNAGNGSLHRLRAAPIAG